MRAIVLGIGSSGTSYYAQLADRMGWTVPRPLARPRWKFITFETQESRAINEMLVGPKRRVYDPDLRVGSPSAEVVERASSFVSRMDQKYPYWLFKDPRSTLTFSVLWSRFEWDRVICVYRNPLQTIRSLIMTHVPDDLKDERILAQTWIRWSECMLALTLNRVSFIRFPVDEQLLAESLGRRIPKRTGFKPRKVSQHTTLIPQWADYIWQKLQARREETKRALCFTDNAPHAASMS